MSHSPFGRYNQRSFNRGATPVPKEVTLKDFSGGLNLVDNDLRIKTNFAKVSININRDVDGTLSIRFGTGYKWDVSGDINGDIIEKYYFRDKIIVFTDAGEICTIDSNGTITTIWDSAIAALLPGAPSGWSTGLTLIDVTEFRNELVCNNGTDKPILISSTHTVTYLQDIPTGSNTNTPTGKYGTTVGNFCVIAGISAAPNTIYISNEGTSGTWPGDPTPNNAISINIDAYSSETGGDLRGLTSFRNFLIVHFATTSLVIELGIFDGSGNHTPDILDTIPKQGVISHRTSVTLDTDYVFADEKGVYRARRNTFGAALEVKKLSDKIQPDWIKAVSDNEADRLKSYAVVNELENRVIFFLYKGASYTVFSMSFDEGAGSEGLKRVAWNVYDGWSWNAATSSVKGRVFFSEGAKIYQLGNSVFGNEEYTADFTDDYDSAWLTATSYSIGDRVLESGTVYICLIAHTSGTFATDLAAEKWEEYFGEAIDFDLELPWTDVNIRMTKKRLSYIGIDTTGLASFTIEAYVDNFRLDENGLDDPAISMQFVAGDSPGYGGGNQPFGGGRRAVDERLWGFPCEFKILKLRIKGSTKKRMQVVAISLLYTKGTYKR